MSDEPVSTNKISSKKKKAVKKNVQRGGVCMSILQHKTEHCMFCNKEHKDHTEKLWKLHKSTVEVKLKSTRHKKIWPMHLGFGPTCKAILSDGFEYDKGYVIAEWLKPIYMSCSECGRYLGKIEEDHADVLDSLCLGCFKQLTDWEEIPLCKTGSISAGEFDRRMALMRTKKSGLDLDSPKTWSDSFKKWHYKFIRSWCDHKKHCMDCKYCKKEWFVESSPKVYPYAPFTKKELENV